MRESICPIVAADFRKHPPFYSLPSVSAFAETEMNETKPLFLVFVSFSLTQLCALTDSSSRYGSAVAETKGSVDFEAAKKSAPTPPAVVNIEWEDGESL